MGGNALAMVGGTRLGPVTRQLDSPAPEQSLRVQCGGQQFGNEVDGPGMRPRPAADGGDGQLSGALASVRRFVGGCKNSCFNTTRPSW